MNDLKSWVEELRNSNELIIVEGKKDKRALESLGITNIIILNKPLFEVVEKVSSNNTRCVLLTDLDKKGKMLYAKLKKDLQRNGVKTIDSYRNFLFKHTNLLNIEGLITYINRNPML